MTNPTILGQTFFNLVSAMGPVRQDWDTTSASGNGALAVNDANLSGTTIVMGASNAPIVNGDALNSVVGNHNAAVTGDSSAANFGAGGVAGVADNLNVGSGDLIDIDRSTVSESALGHSAVQSNDIAVDADRGSAVAFGGDARGSDVDTNVWGNSGNVGVQVGEHQNMNQLNDHSTELSFDLDQRFDLDFRLHDYDHYGDDVRILDAFKVVDSFKAYDSFNQDNDHIDIG